MPLQLKIGLCSCSFLLVPTHELVIIQSVFHCHNKVVIKKIRLVLFKYHTEQIKSPTNLLLANG